MEFPANLVSDSPLVKDTFDFVTASGGRAKMCEVAETVFRLSQAGDELATALVSDLICNDPRFRIEKAHVSISDDGVESRPLNDLEFVVFDLEAVTPKPLPAKIIELAAYRVRGGEISAEFQTLVNPGVPLSPFIIQLTGLSDDMVKAAPSFSEVIAPWLQFAGDAILVAHNSDFDVPLLNQEIGRVFPGRRMRNSELCTVKLARRLIRNSIGHNLDALAEHLGFEIPERHRAASDARATVRVLLHLLDELEKHGVQTLGEMRDFHLPAEAAARKADFQLALDV